MVGDSRHRNGFEDLQRLGADEDPFLGGAMQISDGGTQYVDFCRVLGIWFLRILWNVEGIAQSNHGRALRIIGKENGCEVTVNYTRPMKRTAQSIATADFFDRQPLDFVVVLVLETPRCVGTRTQLIAQPGRPHRKRSHLAVSTAKGCFNVNHIAVIEPNLFYD